MNWYNLLKLADYEQWAGQVEEMAQQNPYPFSSWFDDNGRTYMPFGGIEEGFDQDVKDILDDAGCEITDYRGGYCQKGKNSFRIGKLLEQAKRQALKELEQKNQIEQMYNLEREMQEITQYYDGIINIFVNSSYRVQKSGNQFMIAISQNPQDVAMMSTDRDWKSCMELGEGSHHQDVFCEIKSGGIVAYLIKADDLNIQSPLARIHIRRFANRQGQSIAIPEDSVYGNEITGFQEAVQQWLTEKQGDISPGMYRRQGGEYSDTFQDKMLVAPTKQEDLLKWFAGDDPNAKYSTWIVEDELYRTMGDNQLYGDDYGIEDFTKEFKTQEEAEKYLEIIKFNEQSDYERESVGDGWEEFDEEKGEWVEERFDLREKKIDYRSDMKHEAAKQVLKSEKGTYPPEMIQKLKEYIFGQAQSSLLSEFIKKYPELLTEDEINTLDDRRNLEFIAALPEEQQTQYKLQWQQTIVNTIDNLLQEKLDQGETALNADTIQHRARSAFNDQVLDPIQILFKKQIPEPIIQKLIQYANSVEDMGYTGSEKIGKSPIPGRNRTTDHATAIRSSIVHTLSMSNADTPSVQRFYESLLPLWDDTRFARDSYLAISEVTLGISIAKLGENGRQFIPFIQKKLQKVEAERQELPQGYTSDYAAKIKIEQTEKQIERLLYIIDALQNGTGRSTKYKFFRSDKIIKTGSSWYKKAQGLGQPDFVVKTPWAKEFGASVYLNPTSQELSFISKAYGEARIYLVGNDQMYAWNTTEAMHYHIEKEIGISGGIPLVVGVSGGKITGAVVTDSSKRTEWHENPQVKKAVLSNGPFVGAMHPSIKIDEETFGYYNEDIVGDWEQLKDKENELV